MSAPFRFHREDRARLRVWIDYDLPSDLPGRWFGVTLGNIYGKWCIQQMIRDTVKAFG
jgi:hypothetical protein